MNTCNNSFRTPRGEQLLCALPPNHPGLHESQNWEWAEVSGDEKLERLYLEHISSEGNGVANDHPDGCFYCGSGAHHSQDCPNKGD
jgi:hypothetical protein